MVDEKIIREYAKKYAKEYALLRKHFEEERIKISKELSKELNMMAILERDIENIKVFIVEDPGFVKKFVFNFKDLGV